jgi:hypothetical protein
MKLHRYLGCVYDLYFEEVNMCLFFVQWNISTVSI